MAMDRQIISWVISLCGWLYFLIWSFSFYPQILLTLKQKSALGMNSNYIFINLTGYLMYAVYNIYGWLEGDNPQTGLIDQSDILFSMHSLLAYALIVALFFYFPHNIQISPWTLVYLSIEWIIFLYFGFYACIADQAFTLNFFGFQTSLGYFQTLGYMKMSSSLLKHPPQIYHNFKRKSTHGWSIQGIIMDFLGGFFSLTALLLQLYLNPTLHINTTKLFLSLISMLYDLTYIVQHYILYGDNEAGPNLIKAQKKAITENFMMRKTSDDLDQEMVLNSRKILE